MQVKQVATFVNQALAESTGGSAIVSEDLSNVVDMGTAVFNANAVDNYVKSLVDHIGRVIFVDRAYRGRAPKVLMDAWEYGSALEKISMETPEAVENPTWNLQDGQVYEQDKFSAPSITVKFFNQKTTFEVPISITDRQVKESFSGPEQLAGFVSMIYTTIENSMTRAMDALIMRAINNFTAYSVNDGGSLTITLKSDYLALHPEITENTYTLEKALHDPEFLKFAGEKIRLITKLMGTMSQLYNAGGKDRFTPADDLHLILLSDLVSATSAYLESSTYHKELVSLPLFEEVPYWQANGTSPDTRSEIDVEKTGDGGIVDVQGKILGVAFDRNALGVSNWNKRTTSHRNNHAEFENLWYKNDAGFFNDLNEQFVVFIFA